MRSTSDVLDFKDLKVWQRARQLSRRTHACTLRLPEWERYKLGAQMRQAATSVQFNIAEGHEREHLGDYLHHLSIASGSLRELEAQLIYCADVRYFPQAEVNEILAECAEAGRMLEGLAQALRQRKK